MKTNRINPLFDFRWLPILAALTLVLMVAFGSLPQQAAASSPAGKGEVVKELFDSDYLIVSAAFKF